MWQDGSTNDRARCHCPRRVHFIGRTAQETHEIHPPTKTRSRRSRSGATLIPQAALLPLQPSQLTRDFFCRFVAAEFFRCASAIRLLASGLKLRFAAFAFSITWPARTQLVANSLRPLALQPVPQRPEQSSQSPWPGPTLASLPPPVDNQPDRRSPGSIIVARIHLRKQKVRKCFGKRCASEANFGLIRQNDSGPGSVLAFCAPSCAAKFSSEFVLPI